LYKPIITLFTNIHTYILPYISVITVLALFFVLKPHIDFAKIYIDLFA